MENLIGLGHINQISKNALGARCGRFHLLIIFTRVLLIPCLKKNIFLSMLLVMI